MQIRGRRLRYTAVLVLVVLALTGFSTGRGRGGSHGHGGSGGGGCSSSSQDHDSSRSSTSGGGYGGGSHDSDDDDYYGNSGGSGGGGSSYTRRPHYGSTPTSSSGSGKALQDGTAKLVSCATPARPYATVEVGNPNGRKAAFSVSVTFEDAQDLTVVTRYADVTVPARGTATVDVRVGGTGLVDSVDHCVVDRQALVDD